MGITLSRAEAQTDSSGATTTTRHGGRRRTLVGCCLGLCMFLCILDRGGVASFAGMEEKTRSDNRSAVARRERGGLAASAQDGGAKDVVTGVGAVSPVRRRLARKTSVEEGQVQSLGIPSGAVSPLRRRRAGKTRVEEVQVPVSGSPLVQEASSPERAAKAQRLVEGTLEEAPEEIMMDSVGQPLRLESVDEVSARWVADASGTVSGGHGAGSGAGAGAKHAAAAEARALASQSRGVGDLKKASAMQAAAGVEECFGASRADALREQIRRSKIARFGASHDTRSAQQAVDACKDAPGGIASDSAQGTRSATATGTASGASTVGVGCTDLGAEVREEALVAGEPKSAVSLACFRTRAARVAPDPGRADSRLLEPLPVDTAEIVYGIPCVQIATSGWHVPVQRCGGIWNHGNSCFLNATVQVLSRVEGFVRCLRMHTHAREPAHPCVLCALRDQIEWVRGGATVEWSEVALLARAGRLDLDFRGDATTGAGPQCDAWDCLLACVESLNQYESDHLVSGLQDCTQEQREGVGERRVVLEHVCGMLFRNRVRCAQCTGASDTLGQYPHAELEMRDNAYRSLKGLWLHHVTEGRAEGTRCPVGCGSNGYLQRFLEREPPVLFFRLKRFYEEVVNGARRGRKDRRRVSFPEVLDFMRSGEYQFAATLQHEGGSLGAGHYVATVWEGAEAGVNRYREYRDDDVGESLAWGALPFQRLQADAYVLVYVRTRFWSDRVGDGSERTPYLRDRASVEVARRYFRGRLAHVASAQERGRAADFDGRDIDCSTGGPSRPLG